MRLRHIPAQLPELVYFEAERRVLDNQTGLLVALKRLEIQGKWRDMALSYTQSDEDIVLITIHPLREDQYERRLASGWWQPHEPERLLR